MDKVEIKTNSSIGCINAVNEVLGDKWTARLLRVINNSMQIGFCQLQTEVGGINPRTLSARLHELEAKNIIEKLASEPENRFVYRLTNRGQDLMPILEQMHIWSKRHGSHMPT